MVKRLFFVVGLSLIFGCREISFDSNETPKLNLAKDKARTVLYSQDSSLKSDKQISFLENLSNILELPDNTNVTNDYLRIWFWNAPDTCFVVGISDFDKSAVFDITAFNIPKDSVIIHFQKFQISPVNGGVRFSSLMRKLEMADLPSYNKSLLSKGFLTEMSTVQFEVAKPSYYRYYEFLEPYFYRYIDSNSSKVNFFLSTLNSELGYRVYESNSHLFIDPK